MLIYLSILLESIKRSNSIHNPSVDKSITMTLLKFTSSLRSTRRNKETQSLKASFDPKVYINGRLIAISGVRRSLVRLKRYRVDAETRKSRIVGLGNVNVSVFNGKLVLAKARTFTLERLSATVVEVSWFVLVGSSRYRWLFLVMLALAFGIMH